MMYMPAVWAVNTESMAAEGAFSIRSRLGTWYKAYSRKTGVTINMPYEFPALV